MKCPLVLGPVFDWAHILYLPYSYSDRMLRGGINVFGSSLRGVYGIYDFLQKTFFFIAKNLIKV